MKNPFSILLDVKEAIQKFSSSLKHGGTYRRLNRICYDIGNTITNEKLVEEKIQLINDELLELTDTLLGSSIDYVSSEYQNNLSSILQLKNNIITIYTSIEDSDYISNDIRCELKSLLYNSSHLYMLYMNLSEPYIDSDINSQSINKNISINQK